MDFDSYKEKFGELHTDHVIVGVELGILPANRKGSFNWRGVTTTGNVHIESTTT